jgi:hypothetical protein
MRRTLEKTESDTRIGKVVPQFKIVVAVRCNRCGSMRYANSGDVEPEQILGTLQASADTWRDYGQSQHDCEARKKKPKTAGALR